METRIAKTVSSHYALFIHKGMVQTSLFISDISDPRVSLGTRNSGSIKQSNEMEEMGHQPICSLGGSKPP